MWRHLESTPAVETTCPHCGAPILVALDEGLNVRADPDPVAGFTAELAARLAGRETYNLIRRGAGYEIGYRDAERIQHREMPVLAEHPCSAQRRNS